MHNPIGEHYEHAKDQVLDSVERVKGWVEEDHVRQIIEKVNIALDNSGDKLISKLRKGERRNKHD